MRRAGSLIRLVRDIGLLSACGAMFARGYRVVVSNSDVLMLRDSARAEVEALAAARG